MTRANHVGRPDIGDRHDACWAQVLLRYGAHYASYVNCRNPKRPGKLTCSRHYYLEDTAQRQWQLPK